MAFVTADDPHARRTNDSQPPPTEPRKAADRRNRERERDETRRKPREESLGRPIRIGLLGTSGAGKTTYQTALAYVLVRQLESEPTDDDLLMGNPVGQETKQFLSVRVQELVAGEFPLPTNEATNLFYRIETKTETKLVSIMDYRGGDLGEIYSRDDGQPVPETVRGIADYFAACDGYIFLVNARTLLLDEAEPEFARFWGEFLVYKDVLQYLIDARPRRHQQLTKPFALVASQCDAVDLESKDVRDRLDKALANLTSELRRHVRYPETFLTSAIGPNFLDPVTRKKLPHARLQPKNILAPLRFILKTQRSHNRMRRRMALAGVLIALICGAIVGVGYTWVEAQMRVENVAALGGNLGAKHRLIGAARDTVRLVAESPTAIEPTRLRLRELAHDMDVAAAALPDGDAFAELRAHITAASTDIRQLANNLDRLGPDELDRQQQIVAARAAAVIDAARAIDPMSETELLARLVQVRDKQSELGMLGMLLTDAGRDTFRQVHTQILAELDERDFSEFLLALDERPTNLDKIERLAREYSAERKYLNAFTNHRFADEVRRLLDRARQRYDDEMWAEATRSNQIPAYEAYLLASKRLDHPRFVEAARGRIQELQTQGFLERWNEIMAFANEHPNRYDRIVPLVHGFVQQCPANVQRTLQPAPEIFLQQRVAAWDEALWLDLDTRFANSIDVQEGSIEAALIPYIKNIRDEYLNRISVYAAPRHTAQANQRIAELEALAREREYSIRLVSGTFQNFDEAQPDIYVKVFVNDVLKFSTETAPKHNSANPVWNTDFKLRWKAYDKIKVEIWDYNMWPWSHTHVFEVNDAGLNALKKTLGGTISYRDGAKYFAVTFAIRE